MSLIKWEPFEDFDDYFGDMPSFPSIHSQSAGFDLAADVYEDGNNLIAEMNLPGLTGDDIEIDVEQNHLRISGKREDEVEKKEKNYYSKEIRRGSFERLLSLPSRVDEDKVEAEYEDGVLKVIMPMVDVKPEKRIKVKVKKDKK